MKRLMRRLEAFVVTEYKDNTIFKTRRIAEFYAPLGQSFPEHIGDLIICPTKDAPRMLERP